MRLTVPMSPHKRVTELVRASLGLMVAALLWGGCSGEVSGPNAMGGNTPSTTAGGSAGSGTGGAGGTSVTGVPDVIDPTGTMPSDPIAAGPRPLVRLSRREYNNTVRDLLGDTTHPADAFADDKPGDFLFTRADIVSNHDAELLQSTAETLAATAVKNLGTLLPCASSANEACARTFVQTVGLRAFRRPVTTTETDRLMALYTAGRGTMALAFNDAVGLMLEAMLQSPAFLYHWEKDPSAAPTREGDVVRLGPYEVASRLSYFIWGSIPDQPLFDAAAAGKLSSDADIETQAKRMLDDGKAHRSIQAFFTEFLELGLLPNRAKDTTVYAAWNDGLIASLTGETTNFTDQVSFGDNGSLATLLGADFSYVDGATGAIYGLGASKSTMFTKTSLDASQRVGLLTQPSFLSNYGAADGSHPVRRGKAVYEKFLCGTLPPPPANVPPAKPPSAGGTTRQRFSEHDQNACAKGCHVLMDPIGYTFEHYDGIGQYRTTDNGGAVDSTSTVNIDGVATPVADAVALAKILAASPTVQTCFAAQVSRFALGREEVEADRASLQHARVAFASHGFMVRDLMVGVTSSRSFRYRSPATGEMP